MKVEVCSLPADISQDRRLRDAAEAVLAHSIDVLWMLGDLRGVLPPKVQVALRELRVSLDGLEVVLYPHLLARSEREAQERLDAAKEAGGV